MLQTHFRFVFGEQTNRQFDFERVGKLGCFGGADNCQVVCDNSRWRMINRSIVCALKSQEN
jgi:hypothetical protein